MKNLKVSVKLIISFLIVAVLAIVVGVIGMVGMNSINNADNALYKQNVVALSALGNIREVVQDQRIQLRNMGLDACNTTRINGYKETLTSLENYMDELFAEYEATIVNIAVEGEYFEAKKIYQNEFADVKRKIGEVCLESIQATYSELYHPATSDITQLMVDGFNASMKNNDQWAYDTVYRNTALFKTMLLIEIIVLAFAVTIALFFAFYISSLISKPLRTLSGFMKKAGSTGDITLDSSEAKAIGKYALVKDEIGLTLAGAASFIKHVTTIAGKLETIANGDLVVDIDLLSSEDTMGKSMQQMIDNLNTMFLEIQASTNQVSTGSKQVADGAQTLAQGATEQAASIEELSSSITEIAERTRANAATAEKTSRLSGAIKENAEKGSHQMNEMITAVKDINDASQSISKIINTIDDIAFQTNILALNAAVEAARAGQHGKGFAVVAEEVRNLASKSAEAAKDTGDMIQNSMEKAQLGSRIAGETAESLREIVIGINESSNLIEEIATSSAEQSSGIEQINTGIDQVAQVVQQNSATAEESAAASEEMSGQSDMLQQLIAQFKLKDASSVYHQSLGPMEKTVKKDFSIHKGSAGGYAPNEGDRGFGKY